MFAGGAAHTRCSDNLANWDPDLTTAVAILPPALGQPPTGFAAHAQRTRHRSSSACVQTSGAQGCCG